MVFQIGHLVGDRGPLASQRRSARRSTSPLPPTSGPSAPVTPPVTERAERPHRNALFSSPPPKDSWPYHQPRIDKFFPPRQASVGSDFTVHQATFTATNAVAVARATAVIDTLLRACRPCTLGHALTISTEQSRRAPVHGGHGAPSYDTPPRNGDGDRVTPNVSAQTTATACLLYTSPSPRDLSTSRMPSSA